MVQEICSGVKRLDNAKRNITTTITGLKRVHMLITGVNQLKEWTAQRQYREVGRLLEAVNQLSSYFSHEEKYKSLSRITDLTRAVEDIKFDLKNKVREEFFDLKYVIMKGRRVTLAHALFQGRSHFPLGSWGTFAM